MADPPDYQITTYVPITVKRMGPDVTVTVDLTQSQARTTEPIRVVIEVFPPQSAPMPLDQRNDTDKEPQ
jgi:hypothetical protein